MMWPWQKAEQPRDDYWGRGLMDQPVLDYFLYRGRGRPRKTDYSPLSVIQTKINAVHHDLLDRRAAKATRSNLTTKTKT